MRKTLMVLLQLLILPGMVFAVETYSTVFVEGIAPITIDGDLGDWEGLTVAQLPLPVRQYKFGSTNVPNPPDNEDDLSGDFRCFADQRCVYIAVTVRDDKPVFGEEMFVRNHDDDAVELYFDGDLLDTTSMEYDKNDFQILVTADNKGKTLINGRVPLVLQLYPYVWEALGVRASLKQNENGYVIEVSIPLKLLGWDTVEADRLMGMNVRVYDDDDSLRLDSVLEWADDPHSTSPISTQCFNHVFFQEKAVFEGTVLSPEQTEATNTETAVEVSVGDPDEAYYDIIFGVLRDVKNYDWDAACAKLLPYQDNVWALPMLALSQLEIGKAAMHPVIAVESSEPGIATIKRLIDDAHDHYVVVWAKEWLARAYRDKQDHSAAIQYYEELITEPYGIYVRNAKTELGLLYSDVGRKTEAVNLFKGEIAQFDIKGYDDPNFMRNAILKSKKYELALELQEEIIRLTYNSSEKQKARVEKARILFYKGDYFRSKLLAEKLINSDVDSKTHLDATMILKSIERKSKGEK